MSFNREHTVQFAHKTVSVFLATPLARYSFVNQCKCVAGGGGVWSRENLVGSSVPRDRWLREAKFEVGTLFVVLVSANDIMWSLNTSFIVFRSSNCVLWTMVVPVDLILRCCIFVLNSCVLSRPLCAITQLNSLFLCFYICHDTHTAYKQDNPSVQPCRSKPFFSLFSA